MRRRARVDDFVANSINARNRIRKAYRRESQVVYPPVPVESFFWRPPEDYYLFVSELVPYKNLEYAISFFSRTGRRLKVAGRGEQLASLKRLARSNVEFFGRVSEEELRNLYGGRNALILPDEEDFGITAVEAKASGKPGVALGRGGVLESVPLTNPTGGIFYSQPTAEDLQVALLKFERAEPSFQPGKIRIFANRFSTSVFDMKMQNILSREESIDFRYKTATVAPRCDRVADWMTWLLDLIGCGGKI